MCNAGLANSMAGDSQIVMLLKKAIAALLLVVGMLVPRICFGATGAAFSVGSPMDKSPIASFVAASRGTQCGANASSLDEDTTASFRAVPLSLAMADFTGDSHPDLATIGFDRLDASNGYYVIVIALSEGARQALSFIGPAEGVFVTAKDVTGDGVPDLVVRTALSRRLVAIFLNDGCGHFSATKMSNAAHSPRDLSPHSMAHLPQSGHPPAVAGLSGRDLAGENWSSLPSPNLNARAPTASSSIYAGVSEALKSNRSPPLS
jgi:hypothetical protein